jgi:hypothetical protein
MPTVKFKCSLLTRLLKPRPVRLFKDPGLRRSGATPRKWCTSRRIVKRCVQTAANLSLSQPSEDFKMSLETILIIVLIVFLLGGGGWYWRGRG